jgi:hypothetical protein
MEQKLFERHLTELADWVLGTSFMADPRGGQQKNGPKQKDPPSGGAYPVVLAIRPRAKTCTGDRSLCDYDKTYRRTPEGWDQYCKECRTHANVRPIKLKEINKSVGT